MKSEDVLYSCGDVDIFLPVLLPTLADAVPVIARVATLHSSVTEFVTVYMVL